MVPVTSHFRAADIISPKDRIPLSVFCFCSNHNHTIPCMSFESAYNVQKNLIQTHSQDIHQNWNSLNSRSTQAPPILNLSNVSKGHKLTAIFYVFPKNNSSIFHVALGVDTNVDMKAPASIWTRGTIICCAANFEHATWDGCKNSVSRVGRFPNKG